MSAIFNVLDKFWKITEKSDAKTHAHQTLPAGIKEVNNIPYMDDGNHYHLLDCYYPEENNNKLPVVIDIHGGGWMYADKELNKIYCEYIAKRGFAVFNISYRLCPDVTVPDQLRDCAEALRFISTILKDFPVDADNIMLTGDSAGGQLAAYSAVLAGSPELREIFGTVDPGLKFRAVTLTSPVAYMNTPGAMGLYTKLMWGEDAFEKPTAAYMNLDNIIRFANLPPVFLVTSSGDFLAHSQTRAAYALLMSEGTEAKMMDFPKFEGKHLPHVFGVLEPEQTAGRMYIDAMCKFFTERCK